MGHRNGAHVSRLAPRNYINFFQFVDGFRSGSFEGESSTGASIFVTLYTGLYRIVNLY